VLAASSYDGALAYAAGSIGGEQINLGSVGIDALVTLIIAQELWPLWAISCSAGVIGAGSEIKATTIKELMGTILVAASAANQSIDTLDADLTLPAGADEEACRLSSRERANLLSCTVNSCNIEELFPDHAWTAHEEESAAACYHTLAASFIRLGDVDTAMQCLSYSDQLEESPRSLALRAIISQSSGETLGAVANMVSSLQQYEVRKKNSENKHYLTFAPRDLEQVNVDLQAGLKALNQRDNQKAFEHFAAAVFNFDSFYQENGVVEVVQ
jgi:hypothetical protein